MSKGVVIVCGAVLCALGLGWADSKPKDQGPPVARIGGVILYESDLLSEMQAQIRQIQTQEYEMKSRILEGLINRKLVEAEAKRKDLAADKLMAQEVDSKIGDPTSAEVELSISAKKTG